MGALNLCAESLKATWGSEECPKITALTVYFEASTKNIEFSRQPGDAEEEEEREGFVVESQNSTSSEISYF